MELKSSFANLIFVSHTQKKPEQDRVNPSGRSFLPRSRCSTLFYFQMLEPTMKFCCCIAFWSLLLCPLLVGGELPQYVDERVARINKELRSTWGRGSFSRWPQLRKSRSRYYKVEVLRKEELTTRMSSDSRLPLEECGMQNAPRIWNGQETMLNQFPWLARLYYDGAFQCGGSLITADFVLTAAHCLPQTLDVAVLQSFFVVLGEHDVTKNPDCNEQNVCFATTTARVLKSTPHPFFKQGYYSYDIALLRLDRRVAFQDNIAPICLPVTADLEALEEKDSFLIAGWGVTEKKILSDVKRFTDVARMDDERCRKAHGGFETKFHICAGGADDGKDSCQGDSGGPLMVDGKVNGSVRFIAVGVLSIGGKECGETGVPALYEKVSSHINWILDTIKNL